MIWMQKTLILVAGCVLVTKAAYALTDETAVSDERNYRVFIERNPFGLKPPPPAVTNALTNAAPKDEILLTGFTTIGSPRAYFMSKAPPGKEAEKYSLGIDEKRAELEVLEINPLHGSVRVRNSGIESVMTLAANGVKAPASAPGPATPGAPAAAPGVPPPPPGAGPGSPPPGANPAAGRIRTIPSRNVRTPMTPTPGGAAPMVGMTPAMSPNPLPAAPNPNAAATDTLIMELQKKTNPNIAFPPTPGLPQ